MRNRTLAVLCAAVALVCAGLCLVTCYGCAAGRSVDGKTVVGFQVGSQAPGGTADALTAAGGAVGGLFGGPGGALLGGSIASAIGAIIFGRKDVAAATATANAAGQAAGWDDRAQHQAHIDAAYDAGQLAAKQVVAPLPPVIVTAPASGSRSDKMADARDGVGVAGSDSGGRPAFVGTL